MRQVVILGAASVLAGCSGLPSADPVQYDHQRDMALSPGHPLDRVVAPPGFELKDNLRYTERRRSDRASDAGSIQVNEHLFTWESDSSGDIMGLLQLSIDSRSEFFPLSNTDGYEFVGGHLVSYWSGWGTLSDMFYDIPSASSIEHECVFATHLGVTSSSKRYRSIAGYYEGIPCPDGGALTSSDYLDQRQRAYRAFGLQ